MSGGEKKDQPAAAAAIGAGLGPGVDAGQTAADAHSYPFYDVTPDGQRFLMVQQDPFELRPIERVLVPNWVEELKLRVAAAR
jgi:hypothetical protein